VGSAISGGRFARDLSSLLSKLVEAIRALAAIGPHAQRAAPHLMALFEKSDGLAPEPINASRQKLSHFPNNSLDTARQNCTIRSSFGQPTEFI
jgi:hypothetical protein